MKILLVFVIFSFLGLSTPLTNQGQDVQVGDILTIEEPSGNEYRFVYFPKKNIIMKRGGIPNMKMVKNLEVEVVSVTYTNNKTLVMLKRTDGGRFFKSIFSVKAEYEGALSAGELSN